MKTKSTLLKMALVGLFMMFGATTFAQTYSLYICQGGSATLSGPALATGETLRWTENVAGTDVVQTSTGSNFTTPTTLSPGEHIFNVAIVSGDPTTTGCLGDKSADFKVFVLPTIVLTLDDPTNATYCTSNGINTSAITANVTAPTITVPTEVTYEFSWDVNGAPAISGGPIGTIANAPTSSTFTMTTTTVGAYAFTPTVKYVVPSNLNSNGNKKGCDATTTAKSVTITPKPTAPTITIQ